MRLSVFIGLFLSVVLGIGAAAVSGQSVHSATRNGGGGSGPLAIGVGISDYDVDFGKGRMLGGTLWADYFPGFVPGPLRGIGMEMEARDITLNRSSSQPSNLREETAGGGVIYAWPHFRKFHPYAKYTMSFGGIYFGLPSGVVQPHPYTHDTRTVTAYGGGIDYHAVGSLWVRGEYEYQHWPHLFGRSALNPQGVTVGAVYRFNAFHLR